MSTASSIRFPIATRIDDQLRGKSFSSFGAFRKVFWISLANDSELSQQFSSPNLSGMAWHGMAWQKGLAPRQHRKASTQESASHSNCTT
ncbi:hypothetical protein [Pseudomonas syringae]|uniref:hypothetical protein n=1 Tax=Pseudomonas syringae TaxID=317 RepID=UPI00398529C2